MTTTEKEQYQEAIRHLNGLFRSEKLMEWVRQNRKASRLKNVPHMMSLLSDLSITQDDLDRLNVIHVTGTKGKGSTCALTESILRHHGYKTLLYSSPHIREIRERIRINGVPLSYEKFAKYFWEVYNKLKHRKDEDNTVLHFYTFLMCLCIFVCIKEKQLGNIEAVIIEGMLGGEFDYTNIFQDKAVCCMTSLGLDHTSILGPTVDDIAWYKSGIFRKDVTVFSAPQPESALEVMRKRANEKGTSVTVTPRLDTFGADIELGIDGDVQLLNASIAILAARAWIKRRNQTVNGNDNHCNGNDGEQITKAEREGLRNCEAIGKDIVMKYEGLTFYLDGAHTLESIENCRKWFDKKRMPEANAQSYNVKRVLIFTIPHERIAERLLTPLKDYPFDIVFFPVHLTDEAETSLDHHLVDLTIEERIKMATDTKQVWDTWHSDVIKNGAQTTIFCHSIIDCIKRFAWIRQKERQAGRSTFYQVLVTGSTGMIGKFLLVLDTASANPEYMLNPVCHVNGTDKSFR